MLQPRQQRRRGQCRDAGGRQLDRQRQTVQPPADRRHRRCVRLGQREAGAGRLRPLHEQLHRRGRRLGDDRPVRHRGQGEGGDRHVAFTGQPQHLPARGQDREAGAGGQQLADQRGRVHHLLDVVEHQQEAQRSQVRGQPLRQGPAPRVAQAEGAGDRRQHEGGVAQRLQ